MLSQCRVTIHLLSPLTLEVECQGPVPGTSQNGPPLTDEDIPIGMRKLAQALSFEAGLGSFEVSRFRAQSLEPVVWSQSFSFDGLSKTHPELLAVSSYTFILKAAQCSSTFAFSSCST